MARNPRRENGRIAVDGMYGHRLENDKVMPLCYANITTFNESGPSGAKYDLSEEDKCRRLRFDDDGSDIITVYYDSNNIPWIQNDEGWAMGVKRDFSNVKYAAAYNRSPRGSSRRTAAPDTIAGSKIGWRIPRIESCGRVSSDAHY